VLTAAQKIRVGLVIMGFLMIAMVLCARLIWLQVLYPDHWVTIARRQHVEGIELQPMRGAILDRHGRPMAVCLRRASVFADPRYVKNPIATARILAPLLDRPVEELTSRLSLKGRGFVWLARKIPQHVAQKIRALRLQGIHMTMESQRFYPNGTLACHVVGFAGVDAQGLEGLEWAYDRYLKGEPGWRFFVRDAYQRPVGIWETATVRPKDGLQLILTLDTTIQFFLEEALDALWGEFNPVGVSGVVMDPMTGEVLAMANRPNFDPNRFQSFHPSEHRNRAVTDLFEPGSVFKVVTAAVALGSKGVRPDETFFCENGAYPVAGRILHDHRPHGTLTFREVVVQSSNIGMAKVAMRLGPQRLYQGMRAFGFGEPTGIELPGEVGGVVKPPSQWSKPTITTVPMGHEVAVTLMQLVQAMSVVANGGWLVRPRVVKAIAQPDGEIVWQSRPTVVRRVISEETADQLKEILAGVVEEGTGRLAQVPGFRAAGKTGTAQKIEPNGTYSHSRYVASFVGFVPADRPRLVIGVMVDEPKSLYYGGLVAAPAFQHVAVHALAYLGERPRLVTARSQESRWDRSGD